MSAIEWTDATWNPVTGCDRVSPGCDNCYAQTMAGRLKLMGSAKYQNDGDPHTSGPGFRLTIHPDTLNEPLRWKKPRRVFVNSMSDLFHPDVPDWFIYAVWRTIAQADRHTFQVLTKRPQRMTTWFDKLADIGDGAPTMLGDADNRSRVLASGRGSMFESMVDSWGEPPEGFSRPYYDWQGGDRWWPTTLHNLWLGTSIESDRYAFRADHLRRTPSAVRFLSLEPLLGPLPSLDLTGIDWVIVGAESGKGARPMDEDWVRDIRDRCIAANVPLFYKQRAVNGRKISLPELDGRIWQQFPCRWGEA